MFFVLCLIFALVFLPWPWNLSVIACAAAIEAALATAGVRYTRRGLSSVGVQTMIGDEAEVISPLAPDGQVKIDGVIWRARAEPGLAFGIGEMVRVKAVDGLTLEVDRP